MKIGIDARLWNQGGVGRYIRNLVLNLLELDEKNEYILFVRTKEEEEVKTQISKFKIKNLKLKIISVNMPWHSVSEQLMFPRILNKEKIDLMHFPYFSVPVLYKKPFVVTIHDLVYHHFVSGEASTLPLWLYGFKMLSYRYTIRNAARNAKKIIAVSNFTKRDISNILNVDSEKIEVIYEAADDFKNLSLQKVDVENYFLFVGNVYPHKNVGLVLEAFKAIVKENPKLHLVFVGKDDYFYKKLKKHLKKLQENGSVIFFDNASDQILASLYRNAICLVRPSLMEGFSLPPLEALANSCLVLGSDIPVHREVLGESIIYFDPYRLDDILAKMKYVLNLSKDEKEKIIKKGIDKSKEFSWKKTAVQTLKVYEIIGSDPIQA